MIYWKEECQGLVNSQSLVVVVDHYDENRVPVFAIRRAVAATGSRSGKNSYWSVTFDEPLSDECNAVTFPFILATIGWDCNNEILILSKRLEEYHPAWTLDGYEKELEWRKGNALYGIKQMFNDLNGIA
ncbi:hypothetical protein [Bacteroides congonensis]